MADLELLHLVARAAAGARPFEHRLACADLWARLGRTFDLVACVLMPNHVHVLAQVERDIATKAFARVLSAFRLRMRALRTAPIEFEWEPLPLPEKVQRDKRHIARTVRYIHLNPSRDDLCSSPLEWEWSTHRDWIGAVARPCVDRSRWARAMGCHPRSYAEWLHQYVSSDTSVRDASPLSDPRPFLADEPKDASIDALATAVVLVLRSTALAPAEFGLAERRLFLLSAARWTRYRAPELARHVRCHRTNAWRAMRAATGERAKPPATDDSPTLPGRSYALPGRLCALPEHSCVLPERSCALSERSHVLSDDELRAMALVLADRRLSSSQLRGTSPESARTRQHRDLPHPAAQGRRRHAAALPRELAQERLRCPRPRRRARRADPLADAARRSLADGPGRCLIRFCVRSQNKAGRRSGTGSFQTDSRGVNRAYGYLTLGLIVPF